MYVVRVVFLIYLSCLFKGHVTWTTLNFVDLCKAPIITLEDNFEVIPFFESLTFSPLSVLCD